ncbi:DUF4435 domain-containing protein [Komagataeibacter oboediens]
MLPRRKIDEIALRYELEPELKDTYVEGTTDKTILDMSFRGVDNDRVFYPIDGIDIPASILEKHNLTSGNRQRVIALSKELNLSPSSKVKFLIDKDTNQWIRNDIHAINLIYTKYCDMECHFISEQIIKDILINCGNAKIPNWSAFFSSFIKSLKKIYAIRLSLADMDLNLSLSGVVNSLIYGKTNIDFNNKDYLLKSCLKNNCIEKKNDIQEKYDFWIKKIDGEDIKNVCRGHDFIDVMSWSIKKFKGKKNFSESLDSALYLLVNNVKDEITEYLSSA